jgi:hypothetical protein
VQQQNELARGQLATTTQPPKPLRHEPSLRWERILIMDFVSTLACAKGVAPTASREEGRTVVAMARPSKASPPLTADGVARMYRQLAEIHTVMIYDNELE